MIETAPTTGTATMQEVVCGCLGRQRFSGLSPQRARWHLCVVTALMILTLAPANATIVVPLFEEDLPKNATAIMIGQVTSIQAGYDHRRAAIFTNITVAAEEVARGAISFGEITLRQPGGSFGLLHSWLAGGPNLGLRGEKVLLFLRVSRDGSLRIAHLYQGTFTVFLDPTSGEE